MISLEKTEQEENKTLAENVEKVEKPEVASIFVEQNQENIEKELFETDQEINKQKETVGFTEQRIDELRRGFGLSGDVEIPSIENNRKKIISLDEKKIFLEKKLQEILSHDVSKNYEDVINEAKKSKIDWVNSSELTRRLKLKGINDEEVSQIKDWLKNNVTNARTIILPPNKFKEAINILQEMTQNESLQQAKGFHVEGGVENIPEEIKSSIFLQESSIPPLPGSQQQVEKTINTETLHHELGHVTEEGVLSSGLYEDFNPKFKETAPDKEYVGTIQEIDTRIRSMFRNLSNDFDPQKEVFGKKQLQILRDKLSSGGLDKDTKDLLEHYDDITLVRMANRLPAI